jgi:hypothetical protein
MWISRRPAASSRASTESWHVVARDETIARTPRIAPTFYGEIEYAS